MIQLTNAFTVANQANIVCILANNIKKSLNQIVDLDFLVALTGIEPVSQP